MNKKTIKVQCNTRVREEKVTSIQRGIEKTIERKTKLNGKKKRAEKKK